MSNFTEAEEMSQPEPVGSQFFRLTLSAIILILAVGGNALVIFVVVRTKELRNGKSRRPTAVALQGRYSGQTREIA